MLSFTGMDRHLNIDFFNHGYVFLLVDTWREDVKTVDIEQAINSIAPGKIRVLCVSQVIAILMLCLSVSSPRMCASITIDLWLEVLILCRIFLQIIPCKR